MIAQQLSNDGSDSFASIREYEYDANGCLAVETDGQTDGDGIFTEFNRETRLFNGPGGALSELQWDQGDNGSIEATSSIEVESSPYLVHIIPGFPVDLRQVIRDIFCSP